MLQAGVGSQDRFRDQTGRPRSTHTMYSYPIHSSCRQTRFRIIFALTVPVLHTIRTAGGSFFKDQIKHLKIDGRLKRFKRLLFSVDDWY